MENKKIILESNIMLALMKATIEQSEHLRGQLKQRPKQVFNRWNNLGYSLLDELEKRNVANEDYLEQLTDIIHNVLHEIRKSST
tara:strand:+ start:304 stop:555 length:252 start_codon:yes stop_codon:yes gene_type:complete